MSDFIYSKRPVKPCVLREQIEKIYRKDIPSVKEFHGEWGSLAVSRNLYRGFQPFETDNFILSVLGGPVLGFRTNLLFENPTAGSQAIYNRWISGKINWDEDLSGPFSVLIISKATGEVNCITDLMSFIPVYAYQEETRLLLSSHVDVLARTANQEVDLDLVSQVDFLLHGVVTYPYTGFKKIRQIAPASVHQKTVGEDQLNSSAYWRPIEENFYSSIGKAAEDLKKGFKEYVDSVTDGIGSIGQFLSGGEDSRILAALLPGEPDAFVFLDSMNREGKIARAAAKIYGINLKVAIRNKTHYLDILPPCTNLVGSGTEYKHVHTFGFHKNCNLRKYDAVFGGLFADALLKGSHIIKKRPTMFGPEVKDENFTRAKPLDIQLISTEIKKRLEERRSQHLSYVKELRKESSEEWFDLWPSSMNRNVGNLHGNRRLFRSYEPFLCKDVVKISAAVPQKWKLNRRLFHSFAIPFFRPSKLLVHTNGRLPYFPWYMNRLIRSIVLRVRKMTQKSGINQGPWSQLCELHKSNDWHKAIKAYSGGITELEAAFEEKNIYNIFKGSALGVGQKTNLMQLLYTHHKS